MLLLTQLSLGLWMASLVFSVIILIGLLLSSGASVLSVAWLINLAISGFLLYHVWNNWNDVSRCKELLQRQA